MKKTFTGIVMALALTAVVLAGFTCVSFADTPSAPDNLKVKSYFDHFDLIYAENGYSYGIVVSASSTAPSSTDGVPFQGARIKDGELTLTTSYGEVKPNKVYYIHVCRKNLADQVSDWATYKSKTAKVPVPTSVKATAGKKKMTVKWKSSGYSDFKFKVKYSAKGVKAKTVTVKATEKNYKNPSVKIKGLKKGKKYTVRVMAITYDGYKSSWSKAATSGKIK